MNNLNPIKTHSDLNLSDQTKFRLNKINKIKDYFNSEIHERKTMSKLCVADVVKNINVKVFNLMSWSNQTKHIEWNETCKWKCRLDSSVCNNKQRWNEDKCRCECRELINKRMCIKDLFGILLIAIVNAINHVT